MADSRFGFSGLNYSTQGNKNSSFGVLNKLSQDGLIVPYRVKSVVLTDSHPRFKELGEWNGLGIAEIDSIIQPKKSNKPFPTARPLNPNNKKFPLVNEIVYVLKLPNTDLNDTTSGVDLYYIDIVGLWNHPHHNAFPSDPNTLPSNQSQDYSQTQAGSVRRVTDNSTEIYLGNTFNEKPNIHPLLPFEGDSIYEGRFGNSIRLGSTVVNKQTNQGQNNWSEGPLSPGDPITIIRNGQNPDSSNEGWIPIIEDINKDISSIYITSTQTIPIDVLPKTDFYSYSTNKPKGYNQYNDSQIILNSNRLLLNTKKDHILLSSAKSINLSAIDSINIDVTGDFVVQTTGKTYLGSKDATQPLILGDELVNKLDLLLDTLVTFFDIAKKTTSTEPGTLLGQFNIISKQASSTLNDLKKSLNQIKSKSNYTI
jgi:hypothetical protein